MKKDTMCLILGLLLIVVGVTSLLSNRIRHSEQKTECTLCIQLETDVEGLTTALEGMLEIVKEHVLDKEKHN